MQTSWGERTLLAYHTSQAHWSFYLQGPQFLQLRTLSPCFTASLCSCPSQTSKISYYNQAFHTPRVPCVPLTSLFSLGKISRCWDKSHSLPAEHLLQTSEKWIARADTPPPRATVLPTDIPLASSPSHTPTLLLHTLSFYFCPYSPPFTLSASDPLGKQKQPGRTFCTFPPSCLPTHKLLAPHPLPTPSTLWAHPRPGPPLVSIFY